VYNLYGRNNAYNRYFAAKQSGPPIVVTQAAVGSYQVSIFNSTVASLTYSFKFK